jgi:hypothetical protein
MRLWFPIIVPPLVVLAQQSANYALVAMECHNQQRLPVHIVTLVALLIALAGVAIAWGRWRSAGASAPEASGDQLSRTRFLAIVGVSVSALMALAIVAQWLTTAFVTPCVW